MINIAIVNNAPNIISDAALAAMVPAFQKYINEYLIPAWGFDTTTLHYVPHGQKADPSMWWIVVARHSFQLGILGYHDIHPNGLPYAKIFAADDRRYGANLSVTLTHELAEMLGDPSADQTINMGNPDQNWAEELCDAVEADSLAINVDGTLDGTMCSNFVLPDYFRQNSTGPWDYQGVLSGPCPALTPGGYMSYVDQNGNWNQVNAQLVDGNNSYRSSRKGRNARRAEH